MPRAATKSKKSSKKVSSPSFISRLRKLPKKNLAYLSMCGLLILSTAGYAGINYFQSRQIKAAAENWTFLGRFYDGDQYSPYIKVYACKTYVNAYGGVYKVTVMVDRSYARAADVYQLQTKRAGKMVQNQSTTSWWGNVSKLTTNASILNKDVVAVTVQDYNPQVFATYRGWAIYDIAKFSNC